MPSFEISESSCDCPFLKIRPEGVKKEDCIGPFTRPNSEKIWEYKEDICPHQIAHWVFFEEDFD